MINCPCGFGKNLKDDLDKCPVCDMKLSPLRKIAQAEDRLHRLQEARVKQSRETALLKKMLIIIPAGILIVSLAVFLMLREPEPVSAPSLEVIAAELEGMLNELLSPEGLAIEVLPSGDKLAIYGEVPTGFHKDVIAAMAAEKAGAERLDLEHLLVLSSSEEDPEVPALFLYRVQPGDTLAGIARIFYGNHEEWTRIYEANRDLISDYNIIKVGQLLEIPVDRAELFTDKTGLDLD